MRIAVCIKQVPDTEARLRLNREASWIDEEDLPFVINESDECALEEAIRLREDRDGEVAVFSLGPERVREALRKALALGADRALHLDDSAFHLGDATATARVLAAALRGDGEPFDLVLTGSRSDDHGWGVTASLLAAELGLPHAWLVMGIDVADDGSSAKVVREMEAGKNEIFRMPLPAVLEVQAGINHPRYASLKGIMQAKRKEITKLDAAALGLEGERVGERGSRVAIVSVAFPESGEGAKIIEGDAATASASLVELLQTEARVL